MKRMSVLRTKYRLWGSFWVQNLHFVGADEDDLKGSLVYAKTNPGCFESVLHCYVQVCLDYVKRLFVLND